MSQCQASVSQSEGSVSGVKVQCQDSVSQCQGSVSGVKVQCPDVKVQCQGSVSQCQGSVSLQIGSTHQDESIGMGPATQFQIWKELESKYSNFGTFVINVSSTPTLLVLLFKLISFERANCKLLEYINKTISNSGIRELELF